MTISREVLLDLYRHARREFPRECCGFLQAGDGPDLIVHRCMNRIEEPVPGRRTSPRTARNGFRIAGPELEAMKASFESDRPAKVVYHSHCSGDAQFSEQDSRAALGGGLPVDHLVVGIDEHRVVEARLFRRHRLTFVEIERFDGADL